LRERCKRIRGIVDNLREWNMLISSCLLNILLVNVIRIFSVGFTTPRDMHYEGNHLSNILIYVFKKYFTSLLKKFESYFSYQSWYFLRETHAQWNRHCNKYRNGRIFIELIRIKILLVFKFETHMEEGNDLNPRSTNGRLESAINVPCSRPSV